MTMATDKILPARSPEEEETCRMFLRHLDPFIRAMAESAGELGGEVGDEMVLSAQAKRATLPDGRAIKVTCVLTVELLPA